jgi:hypothetical protein
VTAAEYMMAPLAHPDVKEGGSSRQGAENVPCNVGSAWKSSPVRSFVKF